MFCKKCGKEIDDDSKFCSFCGSEQNISVSESQIISKDDDLQIKSEEKSKKKYDKILPSIIIGIIMLFAICALISVVNNETSNNSNNKEPVEIPKNNITYINLSFGNVIQDGKQAVFFEFSSDYAVTKIEISGTLLDKNGNILYTFNDSLTFGTPTCNPKPAIRIESHLIKSVASVSFTTIKAYTTEEVNSPHN